jgi:SAM-dependent methyltransferase
MKQKWLEYLVCPMCEGELLLANVRIKNNDAIEEGTLQCGRCNKKFEIVRYIPRFVSLENYASGFGFEWTKHARTQFDSYSGDNVSEARFFSETKWARNLSGEVILEVGSGSGRFTEQALATGAIVVSMDYSYAVEANYASNGSNDNVFIVQADLYKMPFKKSFFDKVLCIGVLQHTPNVERAFAALPKYLKPGGSLVIDVYRKRSFVERLFMVANWARLFTKNMSHERLYKWVSVYVNAIWPIITLIHTHYGPRLSSILVVPYYGNKYKLSEEMLKEWAILDTFDRLSPVYDNPQTIETITKWFANANLAQVDIQYGLNGIVGRAKKV